MSMCALSFPLYIAWYCVMCVHTCVPMFFIRKREREKERKKRSEENGYTSISYSCSFLLASIIGWSVYIHLVQLKLSYELGLCHEWISVDLTTKVPRKKGNLFLFILLNVLVVKRLKKDKSGFLVYYDSSGAYNLVFLNIFDKKKKQWKRLQSHFSLFIYY